MEEVTDSLSPLRTEGGGEGFEKNSENIFPPKMGEPEN
jgi:hypothetical protein